MKVIELGVRLGAVSAGIASVERLDHQSVVDILPSARTCVVVACGQSHAALKSRNLQVKQNDTLVTYETVRAICKQIATALEDAGFEAVAIPAFLPIDMSEGKSGMVGPIDLRRAAVEAGVGSYGESGLILVVGYGPRVRLGAVLTSAPLNQTKKKSNSLCPPGCDICISGCPSKALHGGGQVDKRACGKEVLKFGLRGMMRFLSEISGSPETKRIEMIKGYEFRELWQTLAAGSYYSCFECQALCPVGKAKRPRK